VVLLRDFFHYTVPSRDNTGAAREAGLEKQARTVLMGREVSKIFQANSGAVRGEVAAVNHTVRIFLLEFENHATFEVAEAEVRAMLVDDAVGPLRSPPAQLSGTNLPRSGPVVPLPTKGLVSQPTDLAGALSVVALDAELQAEVIEIAALFASPARKPATLVGPVRTRDVEGHYFGAPELKPSADAEPCHRRPNALQEGKLAALHQKRVLAWNYLHKQVTKASATGSTPKLSVFSGEALGKLQLVAAAHGWLGAATADNREKVAESLLAKAREQRIAYRAVAILGQRRITPGDTTSLAPSCTRTTRCTCSTILCKAC
jgi:hypothetical protein